MKVIDRYRGCLLGLATGDAVGTSLEFQSPGMFSPLDDMIGGGPFDLAPGQWTDDTSMALCLSESLIEKQEFDARDQMDRYMRWYRHGYLSSTDRVFDVGGTVSRALQRYERSGKSCRLLPAPMLPSHPMSAGACAMRFSGSASN